MQAKILIIENNKALAELWGNYLRKHSFDVRTLINNVTDISEVTDWGMPDIIISGIEFEEEILSGEEICKSIFGDKLPEKKLLPVIQLYGSYMSENQKNGLKGSPFILLQKPVSLALLLDSTRKAYFKHITDYLQKRKTPMMTAELSGQALIGIFQFIDAGSRTGAIVVESPMGNAMINFNSAQIVNAECLNLLGEEAVLEVLSWEVGNASLYELEIVSSEPKYVVPDIQTLLAQCLRERDAVEMGEKKLAADYIKIYPNDEAQISDDALFSDKVYIALDGGRTYEELRKSLPDMTYRQIMVTLCGMLERGEVFIEQQGNDESRLSAEICLEVLESLKTKNQATLASSPINFGVFSATASLAKKYIGSFTENPLASSVMLNVTRSQLLISEVSGSQLQDIFGYSAIIIVFDRSDNQTISKTIEFISMLKNSSINTFCIVLPPRETDSQSSTCAELLGLSDSDIRIIPITWEAISSFASIRSLIEWELNR